LTYGLIQANTYGWTAPRILGAFAVAAVGLAAFLVVELRSRVPMLDLSLFRNPTFTGANVAMLLIALAMFGVFFFVSLYMQQILGYSPVKAGLTFVPMTVLIILIAPQAGRISDNVGARWIVGAGLTLVAISLLLFSRLDETARFVDILPGLIVGGVGMAMSMAPTTAAAMASVPVYMAGVGSAVLNSMRQVGGSIGIAVIGAIVAHVLSSSLASGDPRPTAFVDGFQVSLRVAAVIAFAGALTAIALIRHTHSPDLSWLPATSSTPVSIRVPRWRIDGTRASKPPARSRRSRGRTSLTPTSGGGSSVARKPGWNGGGGCPRGVWLSERVSHAPVRSPASRRAAMTVASGTGLLSQVIERGWAGSWVLRAHPGCGDPPDDAVYMSAGSDAAP
jgi:MFS family permease